MLVRIISKERKSTIIRYYQASSTSRRRITPKGADGRWDHHLPPPPRALQASSTGLEEDVGNDLEANAGKKGAKTSYKKFSNHNHLHLGGEEGWRWAQNVQRTPFAKIAMEHICIYTYLYT